MCAVKAWRGCDVVLLQDVQLLFGDRGAVGRDHVQLDNCNTV